MALAATIWLEVRSFIAVPAVLASGEGLYLMVDASTHAVRASSDQVRVRPFSLDDLRALDFGAAFAPGVVDPISRRCGAMR